MDTVAIAAVVVATLYGLHRFCLFAESRCWIYYRTRPPRIATLGLFEEVFEPKVEHLVEERAAEAIRAEQDESRVRARRTQTGNAWLR